MTRARDVADAGHSTTATTADTISQKTSINLSGTYSTHQLLVADAYNFAGDLTVNDHLILGKLSDDGNDFVLEGSHTLQGTGQLEAGYVTSSGIGSVDGMTGTLGSGVTLGNAVTGSPALNLGNTTGTLGSGITFPAGHIIQRVDATLTNITTGEITGGQANAVADAIGQITITPGNGVLIYWTTRLTTTAGTNCLSAVRIAEGTVASVGTVLKSQYFGTTGDPGYGTYHAPSIWVYDSSPASITPDYVLITERQSGSTQGVSSYGPPDNACMLFEVVQ